jgi:hypothetical protein
MQQQVLAANSMMLMRALKQETVLKQESELLRTFELTALFCLLEAASSTVCGAYMTPAVGSTCVACYRLLPQHGNGAVNMSTE